MLSMEEELLDYGEDDHITSQVAFRTKEELLKLWTSRVISVGANKHPNDRTEFARDSPGIDTISYHTVATQTVISGFPTEASGTIHSPFLDPESVTVSLQPNNLNPHSMRWKARRIREILEKPEDGAEY